MNATRPNFSYKSDNSDGVKYLFSSQNLIISGFEPVTPGEQSTLMLPSYNLRLSVDCRKHV